MSHGEELEFLKIDLKNMIAGMTICEHALNPEECNHLHLHKRCLSVLERIEPVKEKKGKATREAFTKTVRELEV